MKSHRFLVFVLALWAVLVPLALGRDRNPKDYPQQVKVITFQRQPCARQFGNVTRVCHYITFQLDTQTFTASCFRCDPLLPGEKYPARLDQKNLVLYVIHQKGNGSWGQDDYAITDMSSEQPATSEKQP
ncbi:MAG: hypothetical protein WAN06_00310 [Candidatus Sulfotelmatobacter sp.]